MAGTALFAATAAVAVAALFAVGVSLLAAIVAGVAWFAAAADAALFVGAES
jgi:hypothetical protein